MSAYGGARRCQCRLCSHLSMVGTPSPLKKLVGRSLVDGRRAHQYHPVSGWIFASGSAQKCECKPLGISSPFQGCEPAPPPMQDDGCSQPARTFLQQRPLPIPIPANQSNHKHKAGASPSRQDSNNLKTAQDDSAKYSTAEHSYCGSRSCREGELEERSSR